MTDTTPLANWNGEIMPLDEVKVSVLDRAFLFGDAVYEAVRVYHGKPWLFAEHQARLARSLREVRIEVDLPRLQHRVLDTLARSQVKEGLIYLQVTRGQAPRSHAWKQPLIPNELIWITNYGSDPFLDIRPKGISVITQPDLRWGRCDIKSVNLLANSMACQAAFEAHCPEAILFDPRDSMVTEATHSSLMGVWDGVVRTHPNGPRILPGVTRDWVIQAIRDQKIPLDETPFTLQELFEAEELFLTGTTVEVMPIIAVDGRKIGAGVPGSIARQLQAEYTRALQKETRGTND
jgi:D-alanine transaminase